MKISIISVKTFFNENWKWRNPFQSAQHWQQLGSRTSPKATGAFIMIQHTISKTPTSSMRIFGLPGRRPREARYLLRTNVREGILALISWKKSLWLTVAMLSYQTLHPTSASTAHPSCKQGTVNRLEFPFVPDLQFYLSPQVVFKLSRAQPLSYAINNVDSLS
jgi:hypothetical protein